MKKYFLFIIIYIHVSIILSQTNNLNITLYLNDIQSDSIYKTIQTLENFTSRYTFNSNHEAVARYIEYEFLKQGLITEKHPFNADINQSEKIQYNIYGIKQGISKSDTIIIIGAHYDAINTGNNSTAPGADDNASGIAAMIEIARIFKKHNYTPKYSIFFIAFDAEEQGLIGSDIAATELSKLYKIGLMINNDMILNTEDSEQILKVQLHGYDNDSSLVQEMAYLTNLHTSLYPEILYTNNKNTDSYSFYKRNIPSIFIHENNFSPYYHSANDLLKNYNINYCSEICKISLVGLLVSDKIISNKLLPNISKNNAFIFPNPVHDKIFIQTDIKNPQISIYSSLGKLVSVNPQYNTNNNHEIFLTDLKQGIYYIVISNDKFLTSKKFIKL